jgi:uncharacterized membrane protein YhaH (DUF805 family)
VVRADMESAGDPSGRALTLGVVPGTGHSGWVRGVLVRHNNHKPMTFLEAIQAVFRKYAEFNGRASRPEFWWWLLFVFLISAAAQLLGDVAAGLVGLAVLLPNLAVTARRLHDIDRSGWWQLIAFVPVIGLILMIYWCARPTKVESRYD